MANGMQRCFPIYSKRRNASSTAGTCCHSDHRASLINDATVRGTSPDAAQGRAKDNPRGAKTYTPVPVHRAMARVASVDAPVLNKEKTMDSEIDIFRGALDEAFMVFGDDDPYELIAVIETRLDEFAENVQREECEARKLGQEP